MSQLSPVLRAADRRFRSCGVEVSVEPFVFADPEVRYVTQVVGDRSGGFAFIPGPSTPSALRLMVNGVGTFATMVTLALAVLAFAPVLTGRSPVVVGSGSMAPALRTGDVVVVQDPPEELTEGTVISFRSGPTSVIHRIVGTNEVGYVTKGDANRVDDSWVVGRDEVTGVGVMLVPYLGLPKVWFDDGRWYALALLSLTLGSAMWVTPISWLEAGHAPRRGKRRGLTDLA